MPGLNRLPLIGNLFKFRDEGGKKSELVIFLKPTVLQDPTLEGDFKDFRATLQGAREAMEVPTSSGPLDLPILQRKP